MPPVIVTDKAVNCCARFILIDSPPSMEGSWTHLDLKNVNGNPVHVDTHYIRPYVGPDGDFQVILLKRLREIERRELAAVLCIDGPETPFDLLVGNPAIDYHRGVGWGLRCRTTDEVEEQHDAWQDKSYH